MILSIVIPVFNEAEALPVLLPALKPVLESMDCDYELLFVNDGSKDQSADILRELASNDPRVKVLNFARNFGHQAAITAGLDFASGDAVVVMDADLQDPPELLPEMLKLFRQGYDVVSAQRAERTGEGIFKRGSASAFYWLMRKAVDERLVDQVGDFRLFSRAAVLAIRQFREQHRFMRGLVAWLGLKEVIIPFRRQPRAAGTTKYPLVRMLRFAWTAITSFSGLPLRVCLGGGTLLTCGGIVYMLYVLYATLVKRATSPGWSSLVCLQTIYSGAILIAIGLVGEYVAKIYEESKGRPLYVVSDALNVSTQEMDPSRATVLPRRPAVQQNSQQEQAQAPVEVGAR